MNDKLIDRVAPAEIAGVVIPWFTPVSRPGPDRLAETTGLVTALGCALAFVRAEQVRKVSAANLLSGGLLDRFAEDLAAHGCTLAVIDGALTPVQQRNLETRLDMKVIDRTGLILEIFGLRARTREGRLQVELARQLYERSRLVRTWTHLERQRGGAGFLGGPGETQLEADRRMLDDKILRLRRDLEEVRRTRAVQRAGRRKLGLPVVALVGYTNAGKSTLFNQLTGADVFAKDMPFATLDPTIRRMSLPSLGDASLIDTVGFITDLPPHLIDSFRATLEETMQADLLVHVRDRASASDLEQAEDVLGVLARLEKDTGLALPPILEAWNKMDQLSPERAASLGALARQQSGTPAVAVSAITGDGLGDLGSAIAAALMQDGEDVHIVLHPEDGKARAWLHAHGVVRADDPRDDGASDLVVRLRTERAGQFRAEFPGIAAPPVVVRAP